MSLVDDAFNHALNQSLSRAAVLCSAPLWGALSILRLFHSRHQSVQDEDDGDVIDVLHVLGVAIAKRHTDGLQERLLDRLGMESRVDLFHSLHYKNNNNINW